MAATLIRLALFWMLFASVCAFAAEDVSSFEPRGIRLGRLMLHRGLEVEQGWISNVYYEDADKTADFYTTIRPDVQADIDLTPHKISINAGTEITRFSDQQSENANDAHAAVKADFEVRRSLHASIDAGYVLDHEDRSDTLSLNSPETPVEFATRRVMTKMVYAPARLQLAAYGGYADKQFEDNKIRGTGIDDIQRDRDYGKWVAGARVAYEISPKFTPYIDASRAWVDYRRRDYVGGNAFDGIDRDRIDDRLRVGADFELNRIWLGQIDFGLGKNQPDEDTDATRTSWIADTKITWLATPLTHLTFGLNRSLEDDNDITQGVVATRASIDLRHELADNWVLGFALREMWRNFQGSSRRDETTMAALSLSYALNRYLNLVADLGQSVRDADHGGTDYARTTAFLRLRGQI